MRRMFTLIALLSIAVAVHAIDTGFRASWYMPDDGNSWDEFVVERAVHPDSQWVELARGPAYDLLDMSVGYGARYYYRVYAVDLDTLSEGVEVARTSQYSNVVSGMQIVLGDSVTVAAYEAMVLEYYQATGDSSVMLVVYPDETCTQADVLSWEFTAFVDYLLLQCTSSLAPVSAIRAE